MDPFEVKRLALELAVGSCQGETQPDRIVAVATAFELFLSEPISLPALATGTGTPPPAHLSTVCTE